MFETINSVMAEIVIVLRQLLLAIFWIMAEKVDAFSVFIVSSISEMQVLLL